MNKSPLTKILLAVVTLLAFWSLYLCYAYRSKANEFRALQFEANRLNAKQQLLTFMVNDAVEYSKTHPAMEPIIQSIRAKAGLAATSAPPTAPKPGTK